MPQFNVAIIGAGLSGLSLALALHQQNIPCTLYEARDAPLDTGGGLVLMANGLKVLEALGIYESLLEHSYAFNNIYLQLASTGAIIENVRWGNTEKYGKPAIRALRYTLLEKLLEKVRQQGIPIQVNRRFSHILDETDEQVTWQFADGSSESASILVGADGIHSTLRNYVAPGAKPTYNGIVSLVAAVPTAQLGLPATDFENLNAVTNKHPLPGAIVVQGLGSFVVAPQSHNGDECMITVLRSMPEPEHWRPIDKDKERLRDMFRENAEKFPEIVQNAVSDIDGQQLRIWPSYQVPLLDRWMSSKQRVVILGDAAHALPPSAGQGVNMAFEDVYLFAGVLGRLGNDVSTERLQKALHGWQLYRQSRVDIVIRLVREMEIRRLPAAQQKVNKDVSKSSMADDYDELFKIDLKEAVDKCLRKGNAA